MAFKLLYRLSLFIQCWIVASVSLALFACSGKEDSAADLDKARQQLSRGDFVSAQASINKVLATNPPSADAYFVLAQIEEKQRHFQQALDHYKKALELNKDHFETRVKLGQIFLAAGELDKAGDMARYVLQFRPEDFAARVLQAAINTRKGDTASAIKECEKILEQEPGYPEATLLLAGLRMKAGEQDKAEALITKSLEKHPQHPQVLEAAINLAVTNYNAPRIVELFQRLIAAEPFVFAHRANLAGFYYQRAQFNEAEEVLNKAISDDNKDVQRKITLVRFLLEQNQSERAKNQLIEWLRAAPDNIDLLTELAAIYDLNQNFEGAISTYRKLLTLPLDSAKAREIKIRFAGTLLKVSNLQEADAIVSDLAKQFPQDMEIVLMRGKVAFAKRDLETAINDFRSILASQPNATEAMSLLIRAYVLNGQARLAEEGLQRALTVEPNNAGLRWEAVQLYSTQNKIDAALQANEEFLKIMSNHLDGLQIKVDLLRKKGDRVAAEDAVEELIAAYPDQAVGYYLSGQLYFDKKQWPEAIEQFDKAINRAPDNPEILSALIKTVLARGRYDEAISRLQARLNANPKDFIALNELGEVLLVKDQTEPAEAAFKNAIDVNPSWTIPYINLAKLYIKQNKFAGAIDLYKAGLSHMPSVELMLGLAGAYQQAGNAEEAIKEYEITLQRYPGTVAASQKLAELLVRYKEDTSRAQRALAIAKDFAESSDPILLTTAGWVYYQLGDYDRAIPVLHKALDKAPELGLAHYRLALVYLKKGQRAQAKQHLKFAIKQDFEEKNEARKLAATL